MDHGISTQDWIATQGKAVWDTLLYPTLMLCLCLIVKQLVRQTAIARESLLKQAVRLPDRATRGKTWNRVTVSAIPRGTSTSTPALQEEERGTFLKVRPLPFESLSRSLKTTKFSQAMNSPII